MENLKIKATKATPDILFDKEKNILEIKGRSYPGSTKEFYAPVFSWLENYFKQLTDERVTVNLEIIYFNSTSSKVLMDFLSMLDDEIDKGKNISVNWFYEEDNDDMLEFGEELQEDIDVLKMNMIPKKIS